jgi:hypothetical protein
MTQNEKGREGVMNKGPRTNKTQNQHLTDILSSALPGKITFSQYLNHFSANIPLRFLTFVADSLKCSSGASGEKYAKWVQDYNITHWSFKNFFSAVLLKPKK